MNIIYWPHATELNKNEKLLVQLFYRSENKILRLIVFVSNAIRTKFFGKSPFIVFENI